jgi:O-antigen/teichoic acid export membrane protein
MKDLLTTFLSAGAIQFINIATGILAARLLLPEGRGELAILLLWPVLIADLGSFSLSTSVSYHTARKEHTIREIGAGALLIITALFPILIAIFLALAPTIYAGHRPEVMRLAVICAILIPTYMYALSLMSLFQGSQKFGSYSIWLSRKNSWISLKPVIAVVRSLAFYGMRAHVGVVLAVANRRLDQMILSIALAATDLGLYVVAMTVEGPLFLAAVTMEMLLFPKLASQSDESARQKTLGRYFRASLILVVPATILFLVLAPWLIGIVFGQAYLPAVDAARILALSGIGYTLKVMLTTHMRASNRMRIVTQSEGIGILATVVALLVLLPPFGLIGAAIAQVLAITVPALFMAFKINRDTGLSIVALFQFEKRDWRVFDEVFARFNRAGPK